MYVQRQTKGNSVRFRTYDGWTQWADKRDGTLDLRDVVRFTKHESTTLDGEFVYFGCYRKLR